MSTRTRLQLKQPTGWFAAGREVARALQLLSDATFKVFLWLCLHAERGCGALTATSAEIAKGISKPENEIRACLQELQHQRVCVVEPGLIRITDAFWPYRRTSMVSSTEQERRYVDEVKRLFLERRCVQSGFSAADEKLAHSLYRRGLSLAQIKQAILLGTVRKYLLIAEHGQSTPISSLHLLHQPVRGSAKQYSEQLLDLHRREGPHVRTKLERFRPDETGSTVCGNCGKSIESETK